MPPDVPWWAGREWTLGSCSTWAEKNSETSASSAMFVMAMAMVEGGKTEAAEKMKLDLVAVTSPSRSKRGGDPGEGGTGGQG